MELDFSSNMAVAEAITFPEWAVMPQPLPPPINEQVFVTGSSTNSVSVAGSVQEPLISGF